MTSYLLLRDNRESGPFTFDELRSTGLKPYDLIWVQGRSAAWRYPSEIEELKEFAPVVEEQPFDRFFKKNTAETSRADITPDIAPEYSKYVPPAAKAEPAIAPKRSVFVTLPGDRKATLKKDISPARQSPPPPPSPIVDITETPIEAEIKYSQPLDEIKERYVKTLLERKDRKNRKGLVKAIVKKAAVVAGLIMIGVLAGFIIRSKPGNNDSSLAIPEIINTSASLSNKAVNQTEVNKETEQADLDVAKNNNPMPPTNDGNSGATMSVMEDRPAPVKIRKETMMIVPKRKEAYRNTSFDNSSGPGLSVNPITGEREHRVRGVEEKRILTDEKPAVNNTLRNLVSVSSNDYKRVAFGGIRNLFLTVSNKSAVELDHVVVELQYLKPSEEPLRTEHISFKSIAPNGSATVRVADTNRGIKVSYRIINIKASDEVALSSGQ